MANGIVLNIDTTKSEFQNPMVQLRQGDGNYQSLSVTVTSNGEPFDLTDWTITFMGTTAGGFKIVDAASVVTNASQGEFTYTPNKAWGQDKGEFKNAYFKFVKSEETASGASFRVNVLDAVDLTVEEAKDYISVVDVMIDQVKTDMDTKLAETTQTLADTQSQANTVQTNVNDLNTNVNELKEQNNNIRTDDNNWTGINTFNNKIIAPAGVQGNADTATKLQTTRKINGTNFDGTSDINVNAANDSNLVHFTGTETVSGDKTFTGSTTFTQPIQGNLKTRISTFTDFSQVAKNIEDYAGNWVVKGGHIENSPFQDGTFIVVEVTPGHDGISGKITASSYDGTGDRSIYYLIANWQGIYEWHKIAQDSQVIHTTGTETVSGDKTFTGDNTFTGNNTFTGQTSFWFKKIQWTSGIMQGTWYIQRIGNWINAKFDMSANTSTGTTTLTLPVGYRPLSKFVRELEQGNSGISNVGTVLIGQVYTGVNAMTFSYPTNDQWPTA